MRAFIAVDCQNKEKVRNLQLEIINTVDGANGHLRTVQSDTLHFTLFFLGEIDDEKLIQVKNVMDQIEFDRFEIQYNGIGVFPSSTFTRIVWLGLNNDSSKKLNDLFELVKEKIEMIGFKADKKFLPHLTIFRVKRPIPDVEEILKQYNDKNFGSEIIDKIHLKKSDLQSSGPVYSNIQTVVAKN